MDILRRYSNRSDLLVDLGYAARQIARGQAKPQPRRSVGSPGRVDRKWSLQDRLSEAQIMSLVQDRLAGLPVIRTAEKYGISESSVKRLTRIYKAGARAVDLAVGGQHEPAG